MTTPQLQTSHELHPLAAVALGASLSALALTAEAALWEHVPPTPFLLVYPAIVAAAWIGGRLSGIAAIVVAALALAWFLPPSESFAIAAQRDALDLVIFVSVSLLIVGLLSRTRRALTDARDARKSADEATTAMDAVLAVVAHDLRNPLQTIGLSAERLAIEVSGRGEPLTGIATRIGRATERARRLVDNILDCARCANPFPVVQSVSSLATAIDDSVSPLLPLANARAIALHLPPADALRGPIVCDRDRLVQVLSNLIGNAIQYTPTGGRVAVGVTRSATDVRFDIEDTGPGMTKAELAHGFERLWHGERAGHGSGLGLWIVKMLVEAHGGTIKAHSAPGKGTRISFTLPQPVRVEPRDDGRLSRPVEAPVGARS